MANEERDAGKDKKIENPAAEGGVGSDTLDVSLREESMAAEGDDMFPATAGHLSVKPDALDSQKDVDRDPDMLEGPPSPITESYSLLENEKESVNDVDPAQIALPPSPKSFFPRRQPQSWDSDLSRAESDTAYRSHYAEQTGSRRAVSARAPSGPSPLVVGGRVVSGVMQYAMHPGVIHVEQDNANEGNGKTMEYVEGHASDKGVRLNEQVSERPAVDQQTADGADGIVRALTTQDQDEVWMSFVRQQLGCLFPDFLQADGPETVEEVVGKDGKAGGSAAYSAPLEVGPLRQSSTTTLGEMGLHTRGIHELQGNHGVLQAVHPPGIPDVRGELKGLKDEIEMLRGMVGGIAKGLEAGRSPAKEADQAEVVSEESFERVGPDTEDGSVSHALPPEYLETAFISYNLIRALDAAVFSPRPAPESEDLTAEMAEEEDATVNAKAVRHNRKIFTPANLYALGNHVLEVLSARSSTAP